MPRFGPISQTNLVRFMRASGWAGPIAGANHPIMEKDGRRLAIPNSHRGEISRDLLARLLRQAQISREEWENL